MSAGRGHSTAATDGGTPPTDPAISAASHSPPDTHSSGCQGDAHPSGSLEQSQHFSPSENSDKWDNANRVLSPILCQPYTPYAVVCVRACTYVHVSLHVCAHPRTHHHPGSVMIVVEVSSLCLPEGGPHSCARQQVLVTCRIDPLQELCMQ